VPRENEFRAAFHPDETVAVAANVGGQATLAAGAGLTAVFFGPFWSKMKMWPAAAWIVNKWDAIDSFARNAKVGACAEFNHNGKFSLFQP